MLVFVVQAFVVLAFICWAGVHLSCWCSSVALASVMLAPVHSSYWRSSIVLPHVVLAFVFMLTPMLPCVLVSS